MLPHKQGSVDKDISLFVGKRFSYDVLLIPVHWQHWCCILSLFGVIPRIASEWQLQVIDMNKQTIKYYDPQMVRSPGVFNNIRFKETAAIFLTSHTRKQVL
jgi:hypothetical protein